MSPSPDAPDPAPEPHPVLVGAREVVAALDRMHACTRPVPVGEVAALTVTLERIGRRVDALSLRLLADQVAGDLATDAGFADTGSWLARRTRTDRRESARQVQLAEDLVSATRTSDALAAGDLSPDHARVITGTLDRLPSSLTDEQRSIVEADLVDKAARLDPARLRTEARRALAVVEPDPAAVDAHEDGQVRSEEDTAHDRSRLTFHDNGDGTVSGHFTVPTLAGDILRKVIDTMTAPRRHHDRSTRGLSLSPDWAHRRGSAFAELLEHLPTDHLTLKTAATVVVQLRHDVLLGALAAAGLDTDQPISAGAARRLACTSGIIPTVLGGHSLPLDLGREQRLFTEAQRVALATRHTRCAAAGCERPFAWCELHHRTPWSAGGRTNLADAVPLCGFHHRLIHHPGYDHRDTADGISFVRRRGVPPRGRPVGPHLSPKASVARPPTPAPGRPAASRLRT